MKKIKFFLLCIIAIALWAEPFTVMASPSSPSPAFGTGFDSSFTADHAGWTPINGIWKLESRDYYASVGTPLKVNRVRHYGLYKDVIYQAIMIRHGCSLCASGLAIRATGGDVAGHWTTGYYFQYANNGHVIVFKAINGVPSTLMGWTYFRAVKRGGVNKLKVFARGGDLRFYINDVMVWHGFDVSIPTGGQVGISFYSPASGTNKVVNRLSVDWARLAFPSAKALIQTVEPLESGVPASGGTIDMAPAP